jgi:hypothetical protein
MAGLILVFLVLQIQPAHARPRYLLVFSDLYPKAEMTTRCAVCHVGESKTVRNEYGIAIEDALGSRNVRDIEIIKAALKKAEDKLPTDQ